MVKATLGLVERILTLFNKPPHTGIAMHVSGMLTVIRLRWIMFKLSLTMYIGLHINKEFVTGDDLSWTWTIFESMFDKLRVADIVNNIISEEDNNGNESTD